MSVRRKSLLIGINYTGSENELQGCQQDVENVLGFLDWVGYPRDQRSQVIMNDQCRGPFLPTGHNILAAMDWLVSEPYTACFLHYSGHGGQTPNRDRVTGFDDTIVPIDFRQRGQIPSDVLHKHLVSRLHPTSSLFVVLDCCHSGSALELPYVYRTDDEGNVNLLDSFRQGMYLFGEADHLIQGGLRFDPEQLDDARQLLAGASGFFSSLRHRDEQREEARLDDSEKFGHDWSREHKFCTMFSGCRDDQTSADASISGSHVGAMSWSFLQCMKGAGALSYLEVLQRTRQILKESEYSQIPQLSVGIPEMQLDQALRI